MTRLTGPSSGSTRSTAAVDGLDRHPPIRAFAADRSPQLTQQEAAAGAGAAGSGAGTGGTSPPMPAASAGAVTSTGTTVS
jgi:hypothetical protein